MFGFLEGELEMRICLRSNPYKFPNEGFAKTLGFVTACDADPHGSNILWRDLGYFERIYVLVFYKEGLGRADTCF
jgi:hypothetical protein